MCRMGYGMRSWSCRTLCVIPSLSHPAPPWGHPRRGGFRTRPYETRPYGTRPYGTHTHGTRIHGTRIHGTRPYGTTICTQGRMGIFGEIVNGVMHLNEAGHIVAWTWQDLPNHVPNGIWDVCVVMPNPVHGTIIITSRTPVGAPP